MPSLDVSTSERYDSGMAALLGIRLVSQVLDEAVVIANTARESGQPWQYLTMIKSVEPGNFSESVDQVSFEASKGDGVMEEDDDQACNIATSTPQRIKVIDENSRTKPDNSFIGQDDEVTIVTDNDVNNSTCSTSMFINQLFDMSIVEKLINCDEKESDQTDRTETAMFSHAMTTIMDSYDNATFDNALDQNLQFSQIPRSDNQETANEAAKSAEQNCWSFLSKTFGGNVGKDNDDEIPSTDDEKLIQVLDDDDGNPPEIVVEKHKNQQTIRDVIILEEYATESQSEKGSTTEETPVHFDKPLEEDVVVIESDVNGILEIKDKMQYGDVYSSPSGVYEKSSEMEHVVQELQDTKDMMIMQDLELMTADSSEKPLGDVVVTAVDVNDSFEKNDVTQYGNMYSTLNRDYEQCSEEDEPVLRGLRDTKEMMTMQEIELMTANTSEENLSPKLAVVKENPREFTATSNVSALSGKSSLASRWRSQGSRLLSCLRGWWRRKTPGKRKGKLQRSRHGSIHGLCPLSPDARRRASSLLDQRMSSPRPSGADVWKFNTINETVVNTARYKDYTFDKTEECKE